MIVIKADDVERLRREIETRRRAVLSDIRRPAAIASFRKLYGIPDTSLMDDMAEHGCFLLRANAAVCAIREASGISWHGAAHAMLPSTALRAAETFVDWVVVSGAPLMIDDHVGVPATFADIDALQWSAAAGLPLMMGGVAVGVVLVGRNTGIPWSARERDALRHWSGLNAVMNQRQTIGAVYPDAAAGSERLGTVFERSAVAMVLLDDAGRFERVNAAFARLAARRDESLRGTPAGAIIRSADGDPTKNFLSDMLAGRRLGYAAERILARPDGTVRRVRMTMTQLRYENGGRHSQLGILEDITDQPELDRVLRLREEQLRLARRNESIGQLAGAFAHDFSNSLAAITSLGALLREDIAADDPRRRDVEEILRVTERASDVVTRLLRVGANQVEQRAAFDLRDVLRAFGATTRERLPSTIDWRLELPNRSAVATIDRARVEEALSNLVTNAVDAMPDGGMVRLELSVVDPDTSGPSARRMARISVADTGGGVAPEMASRLWEPFFSTKPGWAGLGLSVGLAVAREHGGDLTLDPSTGSGATFALHLPLDAPRDSTPSAGEPLVERSPAKARPVTEATTATKATGAIGAPVRAPVRHAATGQTILFVEDDAIVQMASARVLGRAGYRVITAPDGEAAMRLFDEHWRVIDLVVTDLRMPKVSGSELMAWLRQRAPDLPILVTSAIAEAGAEAPALRGQATASLRKPFPASTLVDTVRAMLAARPPTGGG
ncbi:MAG: hybrid sensor histidine kinase/response regulator [Gemmatimonadaceae bacterium]